MSVTLSETGGISTSFFVSYRLFSQAAKILRGKGDIALTVDSAKDWNYLVLRTDAGGETKFPEIQGDMDEFIKRDKTARPWVDFEEGDMDRLATMFAFVSGKWHPHNYCELGMYNERFARLSAANYATQATMFLKDPKFAQETTVSVPFMASTKVLAGSGTISIGETGVVINSGPYTLIGERRSLTVSPPKPILFKEKKEGSVKVQYERKQLMDAIRGVQPLDKENRIYLTATAEGDNYVGSWDKQNWLSVDTITHSGWSAPKAMSAEFALKILARMEGKRVTLSWDHTNDRMEGTKTLPGWSPIFFTSKEMKKWKLILAPVAQA